MAALLESTAGHVRILCRALVRGRLWTSGRPTGGRRPVDCRSPATLADPEEYRDQMGAERVGDGLAAQRAGLPALVRLGPAADRFGGPTTAAIAALEPRRRRRFRPPRNRWPAVMTVLAVLLVGVVVTVSTVVAAARGPSPGGQPGRAVPVSAAPVPSRSDGVRDGGRRRRVDRGRPDLVLERGATPGLRQLPARRGASWSAATARFAYGPENFSAFDAAGELFEVSDGGRWGTPLGYGILLRRRLGARHHRVRPAAR